jgi:hypothetical protein
MMGVSNPIHETKSYVGRKALAEMVLDQNHFTHACCLFEQEVGIYGVVQDIHKHHGVEARIRIRNVRAIERLDGYSRVRPNKHVDAHYGDVGSLTGDEEIERPVPAANVENTRCGRNKSGQLIRQDSYSTAEDKCLV